MEELKVAILGDWTSIAGFKAVGVVPYAVESPEDGPEAWGSIPLSEYAVVMVTEPVYEVLRKGIAGFPVHEGLPVILEIPAVIGALGTAKSGIREMMTRALGAIIEV